MISGYIGMTYLPLWMDLLSIVAGDTGHHTTFTLVYRAVYIEGGSCFCKKMSLSHL
jgi:hypothetical protein